MPGTDRGSSAAAATAPRRGLALFAGGVAVLIPLCLVAALAAGEAVRAYRATDEAALRNSARTIAASLDEQLGAHLRVTGIVAGGVLLDPPSNPGRLTARLGAIGAGPCGSFYMPARPPAAPLVALRPGLPATPLAGLPPDSLRIVAAVGEAVFDAGREVVSDLYSCDEGQATAVLVAVPVRREGQPPRAMALGFDSRGLQAILDRQALPEATIALVADGARRIVAGSAWHAASPGGAMPAWAAAILARHVSGTQPDLVVADGPEAGQRAAVALVHPATAPGWTVLVARPASALYASALPALRWLLLGVAATAIGIALVIWLAREEVRRDAAREAAALRAGRAEVERLLAGLPAMVFLRDVGPDGASRLIYRGGDLATVTGWPAAEIAGRELLSDLYDPATPSLAERMRSVLRDGATAFDSRMRQPDGSWRWMRTGLRLLSRRPDGGGEVVGYSLDVNAEHDAAEHAAAARDALDETLAAAPLAVYRGVLRADGVVSRHYLSAGIEALTGWPVAVMAMTGAFAVIMDPDGVAQVRAELRAALRDGRRAFEMRLRCADGRWIWVRQTVVVLDRHADGSAEVVGFLADVTAEREAREREAAAARALERLIDGLPSIAYGARVAADGSIRRSFMSRAASRLTGWPEERLASPDFWFACIGEDAEPRARALAQRALADGEAVDDCPFRRSDGSLMWLRERVRVVERLPDGAAEVVGVLTDVSEERALATAVLGSGADGAGQLDRDAAFVLSFLPAIVYVNRLLPDGGFERFFLSRSAEHITGWPFAELFAATGLVQRTAPEDVPRRTAYNLAVLRDGHGSFDYRHRRPDGGWRWMRSTARVIRREADGSAMAVGYVTDITAMREAEARAVASGRLASLGEMAAGLAHELKQPLTVISLAAENGQAALKAGDAAGVARRLDRIVAQSQRAATVIEQLRRFARGPEAGREATAVSLGTAVQGVAPLVGSMLRAAGVQLEIAFPEPAPRALGDLVAIEQVLVNLLVNAHDALAARPDGVPRRVRITAQTDPGGATVRFTVADNGGGIPPEVMQRLFEPFVTTKGPDRGTGLGLSICHGLVRAMGGTIGAINDAEGAVITVILPAAPAPHAPVEARAGAGS